MTRRYDYGSTTIADPERMIVPIQIREDLVVRLQIPVDLTVPEAKKIARVVMAYADDSSLSPKELTEETPHDG